MASKAQISAEFFILVGLAFLVAIAFELATLQQLNEFRAQKENEAIKDIALKLQKEMLVAATVEDGYLRIFELPDKIDNINYSIVVQNSTITVQSQNSLYIVSVPKSLGNFSKGTNKINKTGSIIYISNIKAATVSDYNICQNAQNNGLCAGLDIAYGSGYQAACCNEHALCC